MNKTSTELSVTRPRLRIQLEAYLLLASQNLSPSQSGTIALAGPRQALRSGRCHCLPVPVPACQADRL